MLKEFLDAIAGRLTPVAYEHVGSQVKYHHKDYIKDDSDKPLNYRPPIHRSVVSGLSIINKDDFVAFVKEYKCDKSKLFFNESELRAVLNYQSKDEADYGDSKVLMPIKKTEEFARFSLATARQIGQKDFVRFLKQMEPFIVKLDGTKASSMDIIEIAEHLQAVRKVDSVQRNTQQKFIIDAEVRTGKENFEIPRHIVFELPVFENDRELLGLFEVELFIAAQDDGLAIELPCYQLDTTSQLLLRSMVDAIKADLEMPSFQTT